jgi:putative addiction module antidote
MYKLKITTVGSSVGVVLPKAVLDKLHVKKGDIVYFTEAPDGFRITPFNKEFAEAMSVAEDIMRENRDALRALAK